MKSSADDANSILVRRLSRIETQNRSEIFKLSEEQINQDLVLLSQNGSLETCINAISDFERHYLYNRFECNEKTDLILQAAVNFITSNQYEELVRLSFKFLEHITKNPINGINFVLTYNIFNIFIYHIIHYESPYFCVSLTAIANIVPYSPDLCDQVYQNVGVEIFIDILNKMNTRENTDIPYCIFSILFFFVKYVENLPDSLIFQLIQVCKQSLDTDFNDPDVHYQTVHLLELIFKKSVIYQDNMNSLSIMATFNKILRRNFFSSKKNKIIFRKNCRLISEVLKAYIPLITHGTALKEQGIDVLRVTELLSAFSENIHFYALDCIICIICANPVIIPSLIQFNLLKKLKLVFGYCSFNSKQKALTILSLIMKYGSDQDKVAVVNPKFVVAAVNLAKDGNGMILNDSLSILYAMFVIEKNTAHDFGVKTAFLHADGVQTIENLLTGDNEIAEKAQLFFNEHLDSLIVD